MELGGTELGGLDVPGRGQTHGLQSGEILSGSGQMSREALIRETGTWSNVQAIFKAADGWHGTADCRGEGRAVGF